MRAMQCPAARQRQRAGHRARARPSCRRVATATLQAALRTTLVVLACIAAARSVSTPVLSSIFAETLPDETWHKVRDEAAGALRAPLQTIVDLPGVAPSGDPRDIFTTSLYFWPPKDGGGVKWVRRDGRRNPNATVHRFLPMQLAALNLCKVLPHAPERRYAEALAMWLRAWFVNASTAMNPNFQYASMVPDGRGASSRGTHVGCIGAAVLIPIPECSRVLHGRFDDLWSDREHAALLQWFQRMLDWLRTSTLGKQESMSPNNHGAWYTASVACFARAVGDADQVRDSAATARSRFITPGHIQASGKQPHEERRPTSWHYVWYNLWALSTISACTDERGAAGGLWRYKPADTPAAGSMRTALERITPFIGRFDAWAALREHRGHKYDDSWRLSALEVLVAACRELDNATYCDIANELAGWGRGGGGGGCGGGGGGGVAASSQTPPPSTTTNPHAPLQLPTTATSSAGQARPQPDAKAAAVPDVLTRALPGLRRCRTMNASSSTRYAAAWPRQMKIAGATFMKLLGAPIKGRIHAQCRGMPKDVCDNHGLYEFPWSTLESLVRAELRDVSPLHIWDGHIHTVDYTAFGLEQPFTFSLVRDPLERCVSQIAYSERSRYEREARALRRRPTALAGGAGRLPAPMFGNKTFDAFVRAEFEARCRSATIKWFCGHRSVYPECECAAGSAPECAHRAVMNLVRLYSVVGVTELMAPTVSLIHDLAPRLMPSGSVRKIQNPNHPRGHVLKRDPLSADTRAWLESRLVDERAFYRLTRGRFEHAVARCGSAATKSLLADTLRAEGAAKAGEKR